jgi:hypothetical protein
MDDTVSLPLMIVVASWAFILFVGFGLVSRIDLLAVASLAFGALAVASAVFLIADLSSPFFRIFPGFFRSGSASAARPGQVDRPDTLSDLTLLSKPLAQNRPTVP